MSVLRPAALRKGALIGSVAAVVIAGHLGGAAWLERQAQASAPPAGLPEPIFIELSPEPEAIADQGEVEAEAASADEPEPEPMPEPEPEPAPSFDMPEPLPELEPLPDMNTLFAPPPDAVVVQKSVRPKERPTPPEPKAEPEPKIEPKPKLVEKKPPPEERKDPAPKQQRTQEASTKHTAERSNRNAARQGQQSAGANPRAEASWQQRISSIVARHIKRTRTTGLRQSVTVKVTFSVDPSGRPAGARVVGSTGDARLDAALSRQAASMPRLPAPPSGQTASVTVPVKIDAR